MASKSLTHARIHLALGLMTILGACDTHPLRLRKPEGGVINPSPDGGARRDSAGWRLDAPAVGADTRVDVSVRAPDARDAADVRITPRDAAPDRWRAPEVRVDLGAPDRAEVGSPGLELLSWVPSVGGTPVRVLKQDQYVYLGDWAQHWTASGDAAGSDGIIQTFDVSDPRLPVLKSTLTTPGQEIHDLALQGRWLFAANDTYGVRLVDAAQPTELRSVTNWVRGTSYATSVAVTTRGTGDERKQYTLVGYLYGGCMDIHGVPDGGPIEKPINYRSAVSPSRCDVHQIQVQGDRAYLLLNDGFYEMSLEILDLSSLPALPPVLGRLSLPMSDHGSVGEIRLAGDLLYFAASQHAGPSSHTGGLRIISVADPSKPVVVGSLDVQDSGTLLWRGTGLAVAGDEVFYLTQKGVQVIDVSTPARPLARGLTPFPSTFGACRGGRAVVEGDLLYVGAYCESLGQPGGLAIYRRR